MAVKGETGTPGELAAPSEQGRPPAPFLRRFWTRAADRLRNDGGKAVEALKLGEALLSERGEVSGARVGAELLTAYRTLSPSGREAFFDLLAESFIPDPDQVAIAAEAYQRAPSSTTLARLHHATEPLRQELFRRLNLAQGGTEALIAMRRDLLKTIKDHPERSGIDSDLQHLFRSWFNGGFLVLRRIDWRTSAVVLERLIQYEAVHQIQGWDDLRRRLEADRRCYAFFHPALPEEPLIFIEVALTERLSSTVRPLLDPKAEVLDPKLARFAIFYSITHCQEGLRGVSFGSLLIKQVVEDLRRSFPKVKTFATLSPIPDFRKWLAEMASAGAGTAGGPVGDFLARVDSGDIAPTGSSPADIKDELVRLCAYYLTQARKGKLPYDSVARFHLANGARLDRLNWLADVSEAGIRRSFGIMCNYVYDLDDLERNHEAFAREYHVVASRDIERLARQSILSAKPA
jgi:malonyl-CoA decarboxylase